MDSMSDEKLVVTRQGSVATISSSALRRGLALLDRMALDRNLGIKAPAQSPEVLWTVVGYGTKHSSDERKGRYRPIAQPVMLGSIPDELKERPQWVCWDWSWRGYAWGKSPISPITGGGALETEPRTWASFDKAWSFANSHSLPGIGYVFHHDDPYSGIDIDRCRDPETGAINREAMTIISLLHSYTELSPSGTGIHILVNGGLDGMDYKSRKLLPERYDHDQYFTVTGQHLAGTPPTIYDRQTELRSLPGTPPDMSNSPDGGRYQYEPSVRGLRVMGDSVLMWTWDGVLCSLDAQSGATQWSYQLGASLIVEPLGNETVFVYGPEEFLMAINASTGTVTWRRALEWHHVAMHAGPGKLYLYDGYESIEVLDAETGNLLWTFDLDRAPFDTWVDVIIAEKSVCITGYTEDVEDDDCDNYGDQFVTCVLDIVTGIEQDRLKSAGDTFATLDGLYREISLGQFQKRWTEFDRQCLQGSIRTRHGIVAERDEGVGIASFDYETDLESWVFEDANTSLPLVEVHDRIFVGLVDRASSVVAVAADSGKEIWNFSAIEDGWAYPVCASETAVYVIERTAPCLYALDPTSGKLLWRLALHDYLDSAVDANQRNIGTFNSSRDLTAQLNGQRVYLRTGHTVCAIQIPKP